MIALSVRNLTKRFDIYENSRARLKEWFTFGALACHREVVALSGLSFDVPAGQSLGIIGRNGAGKSTLLKILAGVSFPTEGDVVVNGRVSALLELGAGFHPEFTGRDNVYMNASLLGMDRAYVDSRFDDIVEFSELGSFIDDPVKFYSSGMAVRLGFSVAIHMDPQILIVDEALAVGDIQFQRKCMNAMREFKRRGVTIILVSHSLGDVGAFCDRVMLIEGGRLSMDDTTENVLEHYRARMMAEADSAGAGGGSGMRFNPLKVEQRTALDTGQVVITGVSFLDGDGRPADSFRTGGPLTVRIEYDAREKVVNPFFRLIFFRSDGMMVMGTNNYRLGLDLGEVHGRGVLDVRYDAFCLTQERYYVTVGVYPNEYASSEADMAYDLHDMAYEVRVVSDRAHGGGLVYCPHRWLPVESPGGASGDRH